MGSGGSSAGRGGGGTATKESRTSLRRTAEKRLVESGLTEQQARDITSRLSKSDLEKLNRVGHIIFEDVGSQFDGAYSPSRDHLLINKGMYSRGVSAEYAAAVISHELGHRTVNMKDGVSGIWGFREVPGRRKQKYVEVLRKDNLASYGMFTEYPSVRAALRHIDRRINLLRKAVDRGTISKNAALARNAQLIDIGVQQIKYATHVVGREFLNLSASNRKSMVKALGIKSSGPPLVMSQIQSVGKKVPFKVPKRWKRISKQIFGQPDGTVQVNGVHIR